MTAELTFRLADDEDLPAVLRLWEHETAWGTLTPEMWHRWYIETPFGRSLVVVAVDEHGEIAAQVVLTPSRLLVDEKEMRAVRLSALTLRKDLRNVPLQNAAHPVRHLCFAAIEAAKAAGYGLLYCLPWAGLSPLLRRVAGAVEGLQTVKYGCAAVSIPAAGAAQEAGHLTVRPVGDFGTEYVALWQAARCSFPIACGIVRSPAWLRYNQVSGQARARVADRHYLTLEVFDVRDGAHVGYTAITTAGSNPGSALLVDILAHCPTQLTSVLAGTLDWLATEPGVQATGGLDRLTAMETPTLQPALRAVGFAPVDYTFVFVCMTLDPSLPAAAVAPARWYVMPGD